MATKTAPQSNDLKFLGPMVDLTADVSNKGYQMTSDVASAILQKMPQPVQQACRRDSLTGAQVCASTKLSV